MTGKAKKPTLKALQRWETEGGATEDGPQTPKRRRPHDANELAKSWTLPPAKSMTVNRRRRNKAKPLAPSLLGTKGGKPQAASMTTMRRAQIAKAAAKSRWNKR
jgi:hypothetical protein